SWSVTAGPGAPQVGKRRLPSSYSPREGRRGSERDSATRDGGHKRSGTLLLWFVDGPSSLVQNRNRGVVKPPRRRWSPMKYLTTLEVAHELKVSKQTLLNWLYAGKIPEPPRNRKGYRLWSPSRVSLVKKLIVDGRLHKRTVVHREASNRPEVVAE